MQVKSTLPSISVKGDAIKAEEKKEGKRLMVSHVYKNAQKSIS